MAWLYLVVAGVLEVVWAYTMKQSDGFTTPGPTILTVVTMAGSFALLAVAMRSIPLGTAYAIWTGIGAVGAFIVGILFLDEQVNLIRICAVLLVVAGLVLMKVSASH